jgi:membrane-associated protease RseP (regulator of RpoE activity)
MFVSMKKFLLGLFLISSLASSAQDLSKCKSICESEKIVLTGPFIGIRFDVMKHNGNIYVYEVLPNTSAQDYGFKIGDQILSVDGIRPKTNQDLIAQVAAHQPGDILPISYVRAGVTNQVMLPLGSLGSKIIKVQECCDKNEVAANIEFFVAPNPASSRVTVTANQVIKGDIQITLFDVNGKVVLRTEQMVADDAPITFNVDKIVDGNYLVKITNGNTIFTTRLMVIHQS